MRTCTLAGASLNQTPIDWDHNLTNVRRALDQARAAGVDLLCLPELCLTGYGCEDLFLSTWVADEAAARLLSLLPHTHGLAVAVGLPVRHRGHTYDCAALVHNGTLLGFYAKQFLANDGVHYEPRWFAPWPAGQVATVTLDGQDYPFGDVLFTVDGVRVGFEICEDAWHGADRPGYRYRQRGGADVVLNPSASHFAFGKTHLREELVLTGSRDFGCAYVYANLAGNEAGRMVYDGEVMVAHHGRMVARRPLLPFADVCLLTQRVDLDAAADAPGPSLPPYTAGKYEEFVQAVSLALFDYMRKSHSRGFVLSLSGGADSSACAVLVAEMVRRGVAQLGMAAFMDKAGCFSAAEQNAARALADHARPAYLTRLLLHCAYQGTANSSDATRASARALAESLGATFSWWDIDQEVAGYTAKIEQALGRTLNWTHDDLTLQNIQARVRSPAIWMLTNATGALLLATSNRSEGDVGYTTMDGDTSGSISPIAGVDKHFLIQWLRWAEVHLHHAGLRHVNALQPSAELRPLHNTQTDEADLMPYRLLYEIERLAIRDRHAPRAVFDRLRATATEPPAQLRSHVIKFFRLWARNQWKRERLAPSFHLDDFSVDPRGWCRFPILSGAFAHELAQLQNEAPADAPARQA